VAGGWSSLFHHRQAVAVPLDREPSHHLVLSNAYVRVFRVEVPPHTTTLPHRHDRDYIWVSIGASDFTNAVEGKQPAKVHSEDSEVHFSPGPFAHVATNDSDRPFRNYTIELLKHGEVQLKPGEDEHAVNLLEGGTIEALFVKDSVRAIEITLNSGVSVSGPHLARPHLLIDLTPDDQRVQWFNAGSGTSLKNVGSQPARYLVLEF
jgi:hypothetical protein